MQEYKVILTKSAIDDLVDIKKEIHILRILREERDWEYLLRNLPDHN